MKIWLTLSVITALLVGLAAGYFFFVTEPGPYDIMNQRSFDLKRYESVEGPDTVESIPKGFKKYVNGRLGFSLHYPDAYFPQEVRETAISSSVVFTPLGGGTGMQVFVVYHPQETIDEERFRLDVPSGVRSNEQAVTLAGVSAVQFESEHPAGSMLEVWAIHNNYLYEITVPKLHSNVLNEIITSWQFIR